MGEGETNKASIEKKQVKRKEESEEASLKYIALKIICQSLTSSFIIKAHYKEERRLSIENSSRTQSRHRPSILRSNGRKIEEQFD